MAALYTLAKERHSDGGPPTIAIVIYSDGGPIEIVVDGARYEMTPDAARAIARKVVA